MIRKYTLFQFIPQKLVHWCELKWILGHLPERMDIVRNRTQQYKSEAIARYCKVTWQKNDPYKFRREIRANPRSPAGNPVWLPCSILVHPHKQVAATFAGQMVTLASFIVILSWWGCSNLPSQSNRVTLPIRSNSGLGKPLSSKNLLFCGPCFNMKTNMDFNPPWKNMPGSWDHTSISRV